MVRFFFPKKQFFWDTDRQRTHARDLLVIPESAQDDQKEAVQWGGADGEQVKERLGWHLAASLPLEPCPPRREEPGEEQAGRQERQWRLVNCLREL